MIGEIVRRYGFWSLDFLKGSPIRKHYNEIKYINNGGNKSEEIEKGNLKNLLNYAVNNTEFYKEYKDYTSIKDFPIIDKNTIKNNELQIQSKEFKNEELHTMSTSGSTGTPLVMKQNKNKRLRVMAELIYFGEEANFYVGEKNAFFRVWTKENRNSKLSLLMKNMIEVDISNSNDENMERISKLMKIDKKLKCISAYASSLDGLSDYLMQQGDDKSMFSIKSIISTAEALSDRTRENLQKLFGATIVSRYSNQENGILAQEMIEKDGFKINKASYFIEFLKVDSDEEASFGELARIVVTDLFNYAMPVIRYDTGDLAITEKLPDNEKVIKSIEGRKVDVLYNTSGETLSPHVVTNNMWNFNKVKQFQIIQEDKTNYTLKLNGAKNHYKDTEIEARFKSFLGENALITIEHVDGIPLLKSGKFQKVICKYKPR
ncbi:phenylacetate-CoA ligase [Desulfitispora alkaliphila]|uniref:phenylacetate--CoA ligase family protein n=1 Tax=Desulfitispora alkaliphila TaxID=622674 RepID=UPI003D228A5E